VLTRRSLFAHLSAVAFAPLVKLIPQEPEYVIGCDVAGKTLTWVVLSDRTAEAAFARFNLPVPQEES
jgi:hypothetical protein